MERGYDLIVLSKLSNIFCYNGFKMCTFPYLTATSSFVCCNYKKSMQDPERTGTALIQTTEFLFLFTFSSCLVIFVKISLKKKKELVTNIYGSKLYSVWKSIFLQETSEQLGFVSKDFLLVAVRRRLWGTFLLVADLLVAFSLHQSTCFLMQK